MAFFGITDLLSVVDLMIKPPDLDGLSLDDKSMTHEKNKQVEAKEEMKQFRGEQKSRQKGKSMV